MKSQVKTFSLETNPEFKLASGEIFWSPANSQWNIHSLAVRWTVKTFRSNEFSTVYLHCSILLMYVPELRLKYHKLYNKMECVSTILIKRKWRYLLLIDDRSPVKIERHFHLICMRYATLYSSRHYSVPVPVPGPKIHRSSFALSTMFLFNAHTHTSYNHWYIHNDHRWMIQT